jgi:hypothetical protein
MALPPTIVALQNAVDARDRLLARRSKINDDIKDVEHKIVGVMVRNKAKLGRLPNKGILYKLNGYRVEVFDKQVLKAKHDG